MVLGSALARSRRTPFPCRSGSGAFSALELQECVLAAIAGILAIDRRGGGFPPGPNPSLLASLREFRGQGRGGDGEGDECGEHASLRSMRMCRSSFVMTPAACGSFTASVG